MTRSEALEAMARGILDLDADMKETAAEAYAQAALQALEEGGMVVVPREATDAMDDAGANAQDIDDLGPCGIYRAMIAASQDQFSSQDLAQSTTVAPPSGLAGPDDEAVWRTCHVITGDCHRCPATVMVRGDVCVRGCRHQAEECINVVETGNPWRKTSQAELRSPWVVLAGPTSSGAEG